MEWRHLKKLGFSMGFGVGLGVLLIFSELSLAQQRFDFYRGIRQMSMGGASVAVVNDETSLLLNPNGLGKLRDYIITLVDPEITLGGQAERVLGFSVHQALEPQKALERLREHPGRHLHFQGQMFPSVVVPNFGLGLLAKYSVDAKVTEDLTTYELNYFNDSALVTGFNFRLWHGIINLGFNARLVNRVEIREELDPQSTSLTVANLASEGIGLASDVGLTMTAPWAYLPTFSAVLRDAGNTRYSLRRGMLLGATEQPEVTPQSLDVGLAFFPIHGNETRSTWTVEYRDVLTFSEAVDWQSRLHVGWELNIRDALFLRAGMNRRYWTAGMELVAGHYQLQLGSFGEEVGSESQRREDRRYAGKLSYRF